MQRGGLQLVTMAARKGAWKTWTSTRGISSSAVRCGGNTLVSSIVTTHHPTKAPPCVDHLESVQHAAQVMATTKVSALAVTRKDKVVGLFTETDYFDKVLTHRENQNVPVEFVARMNTELVVASPHDTVEHVLRVMTNQELTTIPVVKQDGRMFGMVSMEQLMKEMLANRFPKVEQGIHFSEPAHFPEDIENVLDVQEEVAGLNTAVAAVAAAQDQFQAVALFSEGLELQEVAGGKELHDTTTQVKTTNSAPDMKPHKFSWAPDYLELSGFGRPYCTDEVLNPKPRDFE